MFFGSNPLNLAVRFLLELCALFALGLWGWRLRDDGWRIVTAFVVPLIAAALWGTFAVPGDPSRSGSAPVVVPGALRLVLEFGFFASATWTLYNLGFRRAAAFFAFAIVLHYLLSYDRIRWLLSR
jgi:hypothetical protein